MKKYTMFIAINIISLFIIIGSIYINYKINQRWNKMYDAINCDAKHYPLIEQHGNTIRF